MKGLLRPQTLHITGIEEGDVLSWQARQSEKEAALRRVEHLEADNKDLSQRLVEMKMSEMERINNVNQICRRVLSPICSEFVVHL